MMNLKRHLDLTSKIDLWYVLNQFIGEWTGNKRWIGNKRQGN